MEEALVVLFVFVVVPAALFWAGRKSARLRHRGNDAAGKPRFNRSELESEVARLRERLQTVERIVTDRSYDLASEIEQLRSPAHSRGDALPAEANREERV